MLLLVSLALSRASASEQEDRTFTNQSGVKIEASFLEFVDQSTIRIRRTSDGNEFDIPVATLSLTDQQYLSTLRNKSSGDAPGPGSTSLTISFVEHGGSIDSNGTRTIWGDSSRDIRISIPTGNWVVFRPSKGGGKYFIPFHGETQWTIEYGDNDTLWLTRGSAAKELVGVSLPSLREEERNNHREILRDLDLSMVKSILNVTASRHEYLEIVSTLPDEIPLGVSANHVTSASTLRKLFRENLLALGLPVYYDAVDSVKTHPTLECLELSVHDVENNAALDLPAFPKLKHLSLPRLATLINWDELLSGLPELRILETSGSRDAPTGIGSPITTFAANPNLNTLIAPGWGGGYLELEALRTAPGLRSLEIGSGDLTSPSQDYSPLTDLKSLVWLGIDLEEMPNVVFDSWFSSGNLSNLTRYRGHKIPLFEHCPQLEAVEITESGTPQARDFGRFASAPTSLQDLVIDGFTLEDSAEFSLPSYPEVRALWLRTNDLPDAEFLYRFENLTHLSVDDGSGTLSEIDLSRFPILRSVSINRLGALVTVSDITSHPTLESAGFTKCDVLSDFGRTLPNSTLKQLRFNELPALQNLQSFEQTTALEHLSITRCDSLSNVDQIKEGNQFERLFIVDCALLSNETESTN